MNTKHAERSGRRAVQAYERTKESREKEIAALKAMTAESLMQKLGIVTLFKGSRTYHKIAAKLEWRNKRLVQLGVKVRRGK